MIAHQDNSELNKTLKRGPPNECPKDMKENRYIARDHIEQEGTIRFYVKKCSNQGHSLGVQVRKIPARNLNQKLTGKGWGGGWSLLGEARLEGSRCAPDGRLLNTSPKEEHLVS